MRARCLQRGVAWHARAAVHQAWREAGMAQAERVGSAAGLTVGLPRDQQVVDHGLVARERTLLLRAYRDVPPEAGGTCVQNTRREAMWTQANGCTLSCYYWDSGGWVLRRSA